MPRNEALESEVVEYGAELIATTIMAERAWVKRLGGLADFAMQRLEAQVAKVSAKAGEKAADVAVVIDPPAAFIESLRKPTETSKAIITLERIVRNIPPDTPIDPSARIAQAIDNGFAGVSAKFDQVLGIETAPA